MRLSIKYKLFFALLSAHVLVLMVMYSMTNYSFNKGFLDYISRIEQQQVPALVQGLGEFYRDNGSWEGLRGQENYDTWSDLIRDSIELSADPAEVLRRQRVQEQGNRARPIDRLRPGGFTPNDWYYNSEYSPARPYLHLLDADGNVVVGTPGEYLRERANLNPIMLEDGKLVGYLAVTNRQQLTEQADELFAKVFADEQRTFFWQIAAFLLLLSTLMSFAIAIYLTKPLRAVVTGTRSLSSGKFDLRLPVRGTDEISQLSEDFNTLALTLEQNSKARQQWIADISHELRTPLSILQGELESVQDGIRPLNTDTLESLHSEVVHLNALVNDLHELSMTDMGALVYEKHQVDLLDIIEQSFDHHTSLAKKQNLRLNLTLDSNGTGREMKMLGDPNRLQQLFDNLLQNSLRYTDPGGELRVHLRENGNNSIVVEWFDSGPGVSNEHLGRLFDRLYRVDSSRNRKKGGSGLGLAICKNIVQAHEGTIEASHSPLGGLRLTIHFFRRANQVA
jgi:two-component system, OmpR family, sensor histidine kinase BaeS